MGKSHEKRAVLTAMTEARRTDTCAGAGRRGRHRGTVCDVRWCAATGGSPEEGTERLSGPGCGPGRVARGAAAGAWW